MRLDREENIEIAGGSAAQARFALAGETNAGAVFDPRRHSDRKRAFARHPAGAAAFFARVVDRPASPAATRAGAFDGEESLLGANAPVPGAGLANRRFRARLGARAGASLAGHRGRQLDRRRL